MYVPLALAISCRFQIWLNCQMTTVSEQTVGRNAVGNPLCRIVDRVPRQVGVARRRLDVAVPQKLADHRKAFAERERPRDEAVS